MTTFNLVPQIIAVHDHFASFCPHVKICILIRLPSIPPHINALITPINHQLINRLPNNAIIDTYNAIQTRHLCTDCIHLKKSEQDILYNRIKTAINNP